MSGWIKFEKDLADDPRVKRMARDLRNSEVTHGRFVSETHAPKAREYIAKILGGLAQLWFYADKHIRDDNTIPLGIDDINEVVGIHGFAQIIPEHWLHVLDTETVELPDFLEHNGPEAKKAALNARRQERHRDRVTLDDLENKRSSNSQSVTDALPDKTRQDKTKTIKDKGVVSRETVGLIFDPSTILGLDIDAWNEWVEYRQVRRPAIKPESRIKAATALAKLGRMQRATVDHSIANGYQGLIEPKQQGFNGKLASAAPNHDAEWAEAKTLAQEIGFRDPYPAETASSYAREVKSARDTPPKVPIAERIGLAGIKRIGAT